MLTAAANSTRHFVLGTSGHVDHGKTTLVKALTGIDTDRLEEEKTRGITIDLGFANYEDQNGIHFAFVDVPGHEKFVHNMLAGVTGMDAVLLVIAADEGVMPQTREHLQICQLLGVQRGLIVLTRCDLVEGPEYLELCKEEVLELVHGTFLENAPLSCVSAVTGWGMEHLKRELARLFYQLAPQEPKKNFRLSIDRSFTIKGFGTIVTGTVMSGRADLETPLWLYPQQQSIRVRGFQVHGQSTAQIEAGQRAAINVASLSPEQTPRGCQIATPETLLDSYMLNAELQLLQETPRTLKHRERVRVYIGTQEVMGRIILLEKQELEAGDATLVQLRLENRLSTRFGDRFIIRNFSPLYTLGGGRVLDPRPNKSRRIKGELKDRLYRLINADELIRGEEVIYLQSTRGLVPSEFSIRTGLSEKKLDRVLQILLSQNKIYCVNPVSKRYLHQEHLQRIGDYLVRVLNKFHQKFSEREGMNRAELGGKLSLLFHEKEVEHVLQFLVKQHRLILTEPFYAQPEHQKSVSGDTEQLLKQCIQLIEASGLQPPRQTHLLSQLPLEKKEAIALLKMASHEKKLIRVAEDLYYTPRQVEQITGWMSDYFKENTELTVITFKEQWGIGRKHAIELLEYFDSQKLTIRRDNHRVSGKL
ncbi:selenocysteine-specific translation elongation factor [Deltaproteobacteria bacterium TL4]